MFGVLGNGFISNLHKLLTENSFDCGMYVCTNITGSDWCVCVCVCLFVRVCACVCLCTYVRMSVCLSVSLCCVIDRGRYTIEAVGAGNLNVV